jgi:hypothetical protein
MTAAVQRDPAAPPACGACGYDTTGLTSLTCPECGADLRVVGIRRGRPAELGAGFVVAFVALLLAWAVCGFVLASAVSALSPARRFKDQVVRLSGPASGAYQAVDVVAHATGWEGAPVRARVDLQLVPLTPGATPPAPLHASAGTDARAVLAWLSNAGVDASDPRVRDEAQAIAMSALRGLRTRERYGSGGFTGSAVSGGMGGPFNSSSTTMRAGGGSTALPSYLFAALWLGVLAAAARFLWRHARPPAG